MSKSEPLTKEIELLLLAWETGKVDEKHVHLAAEAMLDDLGWPEYDPSDPRAIPIELLEHLELLNHQWIISEDIPALLAFLRTAPGGEADAWESWREYWKTINYSQRAETLKDRPYYSASRLKGN